MTNSAKPAFRIGQGYDVHALVPGRKLVLAGVEIPYARGLLGHSDADVVTHAIIDAMLGAAALGDIGRHFPDTDPQYRGADSQLLLSSALQLVLAAGFRLGNVDATIIAQEPKLAPFIPAMVARLAASLLVAPSLINLKAKTNERLGYLGRGEGIAADAVVLLLAIEP
jgi:2-C-methyl-D-erythritol 2,4-cyclodiphosphate synthase